MASLTPLSKGLIALAVLGGMASAVWHLGLKDRFQGKDQIAPAAASSPPAPVPAAPQPSVQSVPAPAPAPAAANKLTPAENAEAGRKLLESGNAAQARVHLELAVQGGDGAAACHLGEMTLKGQGGIPASQDKAASLFQLAQSRNIICFSASK